MKAASKQQTLYLCREVLWLLNVVRNGFDYDPGSSDLDNEQPIQVRMTLGDYRRARQLQDEFRRPA